MAFAPAVSMRGMVGVRPLAPETEPVAIPKSPEMLIGTGELPSTEEAELLWNALLENRQLSIAMRGVLTESIGTIPGRRPLDAIATGTGRYIFIYDDAAARGETAEEIDETALWGLLSPRVWMTGLLTSGLSPLVWTGAAIQAGYGGALKLFGADRHFGERTGVAAREIDELSIEDAPALWKLINGFLAASLVLNAPTGGVVQRLAEGNPDPHGPESGPSGWWPALAASLTALWLAACDKLGISPTSTVPGPEVTVIRPTPTPEQPILTPTLPIVEATPTVPASQEAGTLGIEAITARFGGEGSTIEALPVPSLSELGSAASSYTLYIDSDPGTKANTPDGRVIGYRVCFDGICHVSTAFPSQVVAPDGRAFGVAGGQEGAIEYRPLLPDGTVDPNAAESMWFVNWVADHQPDGWTFLGAAVKNDTHGLTFIWRLPDGTIAEEQVGHLFEPLPKDTAVSVNPLDLTVTVGDQVMYFANPEQVFSSTQDKVEALVQSGINAEKSGEGWILSTTDANAQRVELGEIQKVGDSYKLVFTTTEGNPASENLAMVNYDKTSSSWVISEPEHNWPVYRLTEQGWEQLLFKVNPDAAKFQDPDGNVINGIQEHWTNPEEGTVWMNIFGYGQSLQVKEEDITFVQRGVIWTLKEQRVITTVVIPIEGSSWGIPVDLVSRLGTDASGNVVEGVAFYPNRVIYPVGSPEYLQTPYRLFSHDELRTYLTQRAPIYFMMQEVVDILKLLESSDKAPGGNSVTDINNFLLLKGVKTDDGANAKCSSREACVKFLDEKGLTEEYILSSWGVTPHFLDELRMAIQQQPQIPLSRVRLRSLGGGRYNGVRGTITLGFFHRPSLEYFL